MSAGGRVRVESVSLADLQEWFLAMGVEMGAEEETAIAERLRDGVLLCQLVNKIRPGSVELVSNPAPSLFHTLDS